MTMKINMRKHTCYSLETWSQSEALSLSNVLFCSFVSLQINQCCTYAIIIFPLASQFSWMWYMPMCVFSFTLSLPSLFYFPHSSCPPPPLPPPPPPPLICAGCVCQWASTVEGWRYCSLGPSHRGSTEVSDGEYCYSGGIEASFTEISQKSGLLIWQ